ncbi:hypothetical protein AGMMS49525_01900 [Bacteroidia bacterium]|nr:hypothetical protein AGMMS49525_01900 [Bacteroidia bacterium]
MRRYYFANGALPFIYVQVSTQALGIIRTPNENNQLQTSVYGEVTDIRISENAEVVRLKKIHEDSVYPFSTPPG